MSFHEVASINDSWFKCIYFTVEKGQDQAVEHSPFTDACWYATVISVKDMSRNSLSRSIWQGFHTVAAIIYHFIVTVSPRNCYV